MYYVIFGREWKESAFGGSSIDCGSYLRISRSNGLKNTRIAQTNDYYSAFDCQSEDIIFESVSFDEAHNYAKEQAELEHAVFLEKFYVIHVSKWKESDGGAYIDCGEYLRISRKDDSQSSYEAQNERPRSGLNCKREQVLFVANSYNEAYKFALDELADMDLQSFLYSDLRCA